MLSLSRATRFYQPSSAVRNSLRRSTKVRLHTRSVWDHHQASLRAASRLDAFPASRPSLKFRCFSTPSGDVDYPEAAKRAASVSKSGADAVESPEDGGDADGAPAAGRKKVPTVKALMARATSMGLEGLEAHRQVLYDLADQDRLKRMRELIQELEENGPMPDPAVYDLVISTATRLGPASTALEVYDGLLGDVKLRLSRDTHVAVAQAAAGSLDQPELLQSFLVNLLRGPASSMIDTLPIVIQTLFEADRLGELMSVVQTIATSGAQLSGEAASALLGELAAAGHAEAVDVLFRQLLQSGLEATTAMYNAVLGVASAAANIESLRGHFEDMQGRGLVPDATTYHHVIRGYLSGGLHQEAMSLIPTLLQSLSVSQPVEGPWEDAVIDFLREGLAGLDASAADWATGFVSSLFASPLVSARVYAALVSSLPDALADEVLNAQDADSSSRVAAALASIRTEGDRVSAFVQRHCVDTVAPPPPPPIVEATPAETPASDELSQFNEQLSDLARTADPIKLQTALDRVRSSGVQADESSYYHIVKGFNRADLPKEALETVLDMLGAGVPPSPSAGGPHLSPLEKEFRSALRLIGPERNTGWLGSYLGRLMQLKPFPRRLYEIALGVFQEERGHMLASLPQLVDRSLLERAAAAVLQAGQAFPDAIIAEFLQRFAPLAGRVSRSERMPDHVAGATRATYNDQLAKLAERGDSQSAWKEARKIYAMLEVSSGGLGPDAVTIFHMMNIYNRSGDLDAVLVYYKNGLQLWRAKPDQPSLAPLPETHELYQQVLGRNNNVKFVSVHATNVFSLDLPTVEPYEMLLRSVPDAVFSQIVSQLPQHVKHDVAAALRRTGRTYDAQSEPRIAQFLASVSASAPVPARPVSTGLQKGQTQRAQEALERIHFLEQAQEYQKAVLSYVRLLRESPGPSPLSDAVVRIASSGVDWAAYVFGSLLTLARTPFAVWRQLLKAVDPEMQRAALARLDRKALVEVASNLKQLAEDPATVEEFCRTFAPLPPQAPAPPPPLVRTAPGAGRPSGERSAKSDALKTSTPPRSQGSGSPVSERLKAKGAEDAFIAGQEMVALDKDMRAKFGVGAYREVLEATLQQRIKNPHLIIGPQTMRLHQASAMAMTPDDIDWLVQHLQAIVACDPLPRQLWRSLMASLRGPLSAQVLERIDPAVLRNVALAFPVAEESSGPAMQAFIRRFAPDSAALLRTPASDSEALSPADVARSDELTRLLIGRDYKGVLDKALKFRREDPTYQAPDQVGVACRFLRKQEDVQWTEEYLRGLCALDAPPMRLWALVINSVPQVVLNKVLPRLPRKSLASLAAAFGPQDRGFLHSFVLRYGPAQEQDESQQKPLQNENQPQQPVRSEPAESGGGKQTKEKTKEKQKQQPERSQQQTAEPKKSQPEGPVAASASRPAQPPQKHDLWQPQGRVPSHEQGVVLKRLRDGGGPRLQVFEQLVAWRASDATFQLHRDAINTVRKTARSLSLEESGRLAPLLEQLSEMKPLPVDVLATIVVMTLPESLHRVMSHCKKDLSAVARALVESPHGHTGGVQDFVTRFAPELLAKAAAPPVSGADLEQFIWMVDKESRDQMWSTTMREVLVGIRAAVELTNKLNPVYRTAAARLLSKHTDWAIDHFRSLFALPAPQHSLALTMLLFAPASIFKAMMSAYDAAEGRRYAEALAGALPNPKAEQRVATFVSRFAPDLLLGTRPSADIGDPAVAARDKQAGPNTIAKDTRGRRGTGIITVLDERLQDFVTSGDAHSAIELYVTRLAKYGVTRSGHRVSQLAGQLSDVDWLVGLIERLYKDFASNARPWCWLISCSPADVLTQAMRRIDPAKTVHLAASLAEFRLPAIKAFCSEFAHPASGSASADASGASQRGRASQGFLAREAAVKLDSVVSAGDMRSAIPIFLHLYTTVTSTNHIDTVSSALGALTTSPADVEWTATLVSRLLKVYNYHVRLWTLFMRAVPPDVVRAAMRLQPEARVAALVAVLAGNDEPGVVAFRKAFGGATADARSARAGVPSRVEADDAASSDSLAANERAQTEGAGGLTNVETSGAESAERLSGDRSGTVAEPVAPAVGAESVEPHSGSLSEDAASEPVAPAADAANPSKWNRLKSIFRRG